MPPRLPHPYIPHVVLPQTDAVALLVPAGSLLAEASTRAQEVTRREAAELKARTLRLVDASEREAEERRLGDARAQAWGGRRR